MSRALLSSEPAKRVSGRRYELGGELARGGMGVVFQAFDRLGARPVAYKRLIVPAQGSRARHVALFQREYDVLANLRHPNIVEVYDYGIDEEGPFYVMELLHGSNLFGLGTLPVERVCALAYDVASALTLVHARRFVHRDVTAKNVYVGHSGRIKLIDFGALTPFGKPSELVGTAPFVAPECLRGETIDGRADLFSLGALTYELLTGKRAIAATSLNQRLDCLDPDIVPPSELNPAVNKELCALIRSLLSVDPLARPADASEVMQRIATFADLPDDLDDPSIAFSFLAHPPLAGRDDAMARAHVVLGDGIAGSVQVLTVEGATGLGRSAMLDQIAIESRLLGATVLRAQGDALIQPFDLARALLRACGVRPGSPAALEERSDSERPSSPASRPSTPSPRGAPNIASPVDAAASHARAVDALQGTLLAQCRDNPTVVLIDDADQADAESLAVLTALAHKARGTPLVLALALKPAAASRGTALALLGDGATRIALRPLESSDVLKLVESLFGSVANARRVAMWLHEHGQGSPALCMHLLRDLLRNGQAKFQRGSFILPHDLDEAPTESGGDAPGALRAASSALATFGAAATSLTQVLSLQRARLPIEVAVAASGIDGKQAVALIDRLRGLGILRVLDAQVWMVSDELRATIAQSMSETERRAGHLRVGRSMLERGYGESERNLLVAANLMRGGDEVTGEALIARAVQGADLGLSMGVDSAAAVPLLEELLAKRRERGYRDTQNLSLLAPLTAAGYFASYRKQCEHGDPTLEALLRVSGIRLARRLGRLMGAKLGFAFGLLYAYVRYLLTPRAERMATFRDTLVALLRVVSGSVAAAVSAFDTKKAFDLLEQVSPFASLPENSAPRVAYEFARGTAEVGAGLNLESSRRYGRLAQVLEQGQIKNLTAGDLSTLKLSSLYGRAQAEMSKGSPETLVLCEELRLGHPFYAAPAESSRMGYFALRGEQDVADRYRNAAELAALRNGMSWASVCILTVRATYAYALTRNTTGLSQSAAELERLAGNAPNLALFREYALAYLAVLQGKPQEAIPRFEALLQDPRHEWMPTTWMNRAHHAEALRLTGSAERSRQVCQAILEDSQNRLLGDQRRYLPVQLLALAEADLGQFDLARTRLDQCLKETKDTQTDAALSPLLHGALHRDRALVALAERDQATFSTHRDEMSRLFASTRNPWLIRQVDQLESQAREGGMDLGTRALGVSIGSEMPAVAPQGSELGDSMVTRREGVAASGRVALSDSSTSTTVLK